jgi:RNA polymerase sigma factor (TIGR02999 family)
MESPAQREPITALLHRWSAGDAAAFDALIPLIYADLRRLADAHLKRERGALSLQPTALVHEAYLRLADGADIDWNDRVHFFGVAARVMRRVLIEQARKHAAAKRQGGERVSLTGLAQPDPSDTVDVLALDQALQRLESIDARKVRIVELRVFGGMEFAEIGSVTGLSRATLDREFRSARLWLYAAMQGAPP